MSCSQWQIVLIGEQKTSTATHSTALLACGCPLSTACPGCTPPGLGWGRFTCNVRALRTQQSNLLLLADAHLCGAECAALVIETSVSYADIWQASAPCAHRKDSHDIRRARILAAPLTSRLSDSCTSRCQALCSPTAPHCRRMLPRFHRQSGSTCCRLRSVLGRAELDEVIAVLARTQLWMLPLTWTI